MNVFAEKLQEQRFDTFEARFAVMAADALRAYPDSTVQAWRYIGAVFGLDYLERIKKDMDGPLYRAQASAPPIQLVGEVLSTAGVENKPYKPRPKIDPRRVKRVKSKIIAVVFGYKMADGRDVADIGAHEMDRFDRDGTLMRELKKELPVLTGNMRFANLRELISKKQFDAARERAAL